MEFSPLLLARYQFSLSLSFHVLFATMAMALGWFVYVCRYLAWRKPLSIWTDAYRFWVRVFALTFFMALASSMPVLLELGILWPSLLERIGNVAGPLIAFGITTLFVIKSLFLGIMFFGQRRVSDRTHVASVAMVAIGLSATIFWGLVLVSWTHSPTGASLIDGRYLVNDWLALIFNPSLTWLIVQCVAAGFLMLGCLLLSTSAWQATRRPLQSYEKRMYQIGFVIAFVAAGVQLFGLDGHLRALARSQPVTAAAVMGNWETQAHPLLIWVGWPAARDGQEPGLIATEMGAKRWLAQQTDGKWIGIDQADQDVPLVKTLFWLARIGVYLLFWIAGLSLVTGWIAMRRGQDPAKYPARLLQAQVWLGSLSTIVWLCLWNLHEIERLPFMVWNTLRQQDVMTSASTSVLAACLLASMFIYGALLFGWIRMVRHAARFGVVPVRKPGVRP
jgi:cytochrome d ubiquinol oxidase subunit I